MLKDGTVNVKGRLQLKHDIEANWKKAENFKPLKGEIIIYDMYDKNNNKVSNRVRHKIGNGINYVNDLPFVDDKFIHILDNHNNTGTVLDGTDISTNSMDYLMQSGMVFIKLYPSTNDYPDEENFELLSLYYFDYGNASYEFRSNSTSLTIMNDCINIDPIPQFKVDTDLIREGYAADAKAVGDALKGYVKKGESENETATVIGSGNATGDNSTVIGNGTAIGEGSTVIGSGTAEGKGSLVIGSGTAYSEDSVSIGSETNAGCRGFYWNTVGEDKRTLILSLDQNTSSWSADAEELLNEWKPGDEISYKNDTRYVLKSVIESIDTAAPSVTVKEDLPFDSRVAVDTLEYDEYSITNPRKPQAGAISFAKGAFTTGINNSAAGTASIALGQGNLSAGEWSYTAGYGNTAVGTCSHAEGDSTFAGNLGAHAEGVETEATGPRSHAEGWKTQATATASHAEGRDTEATGWYAHAEGGATHATALRSHAEGHATQANGADSHAEGESTIASKTAQHVQGKFNIEDKDTSTEFGKYAHIVGNGKDNSNRSNAHTVDWDGNAWYAGNVYTSEGGTSKYQLAPIKQSISSNSVWSTMQTIKNTYPKTVINTDNENKILDFNYDWVDCPVEVKTNADKVHLYRSENLLGFDGTGISQAGTYKGGITYSFAEDGRIHAEGTAPYDSRAIVIIGEVILPPGDYTYWVDGASDDIYGQLHIDGNTTEQAQKKNPYTFTLTEDTKMVARAIVKKAAVTVNTNLGFSITKGHARPDKFTKCEKTVIDVTDGNVETKAFDGKNHAYVIPSSSSLEITTYHNIQEVLNRARNARNILSGTSAPDDSLGQDGDIYIVYEE